MDSGELGFSWVAAILNSGYEEQQRGEVASKVVELLGKHFFHKDLVYLVDVQPAWIPPLLGFLSLGEKLDTAESTRFIALRILAISQGSAAFDVTILPILTSTLLPTHPLQARHLALNIFLKFMSGWFSPQMENVPTEDLDKFIQAVEDPFQFPDLPLQDIEPVYPPDYEPIRAMAILIEFASSDLWQNHLRRSNFTSFEEMVSTCDGKRTALRCMLKMAIHTWPEFLCVATKVVMAIRRLEELQCPNTVEVVIMWAWTVGALDPEDHNGWQLIERNTLQFYQTHGMGHLITLERHIADTAMDTGFAWLLYRPWWCSLTGARKFIELPVLKLESDFTSRYHTYLYLSRTCRLRRLYHLFGYDPVMWKEMVEAADVDKEMHVLSERSVIPLSFVDWACDYP